VFVDLVVQRKNVGKFVVSGYDVRHCNHMMYPKLSAWVSKNYFLIIALVYLLLQLIFLDRYPRVLMDETWYANTASVISDKGVINNELVGSRGGEELFFIHCC